jgi:hypothetical protein
MGSWGKTYTRLVVSLIYSYGRSVCHVMGHSWNLKPPKTLLFDPILYFIPARGSSVCDTDWNNCNERNCIYWSLLSCSVRYIISSNSVSVIYGHSIVDMLLIHCLFRLWNFAAPKWHWQAIVLLKLCVLLQFESLPISFSLRATLERRVYIALIWVIENRHSFGTSIYLGYIGLNGKVLRFRRDGVSMSYTVICLSHFDVCLAIT